MIKYALACDNAHEFEGWFGSSADYDAQRADALLACPVCQSANVRKQIMAPAVATRGRASEKPSRDVVAHDPGGEVRRSMREMIEAVRRHVETTFDYVGDAFAREARDIHEGRSEERGIYGEARPDEVRALVADGISVAPLPPKPPTKTELN